MDFVQECLQKKDKKSLIVEEEKEEKNYLFNENRTKKSFKK